MVSTPSVLPLGDRGLVIELGDDLSPATNGQVRALARRMRGHPGVEEVVPTLRSLLIIFDPLSTDGSDLAEAALRRARDAPADPGGTGRVLEVPVVYGGEGGPDLEEVARLCGLTPREIVQAHSGQEYVVYMLGFVPGYPYLGILPPGIRVPRLASPRLRVPTGSVGIADAMTSIYPLASPGGWRLVGRTPLVMFDPRAADPFLFRPGDRVRFVPLDRAEFSADRPPAPPVRSARRPVFEVLEGGLYTTLQDLGRPGYRALGLPAGGAMDPLSLQAANLIVGNAPEAAAVECTAPGPVLRVLDHAAIAIAGADLSPTLDGAALESWKPVAVRPGQTMQCGRQRTGMWSYIAVAGGFDVPPVLGSASTCVPAGLGGIGGRRMQGGDMLGRGDAPARSRKPVPADAIAFPRDEIVVRVIPGPQQGWFTDEGRAAFFTAAYRITAHSDRAGARLEGPMVPHTRAAEFLSDGLLPGAIQIPGGGMPIAIMPDGPTTGGYPKIAAVASVDLRLVAQARPGTRVRFVPIDVADAIDALRRQRAELHHTGYKG